MKGCATVLAVFCLGPCSTLCAATQNGGLVPGAYDVDAHLEESLGSIDKPDRYRVCLTESGAKPAHGLFILTPDTPLSVCPVRNVREGVGQITFDIICEGEGPNAGKASAVFDIENGGFEGRIDMLMGGKNMRMMEFQTGHRVGDCQAGR